MKVVKKIFYFVVIFSVSFVLFVYGVSYLFGTKEPSRRPRIVKNNGLPLTSPEQWPLTESRLIDRPDRPGVKETRDHRYLGAPYYVFRNYKLFNGFHRLTFEDKEIFKVPVVTDEFGRRCIDDKCTPQNSKCGQIGTFLSSKIFGYGVKSNESLAGQLKAELPEWNVYNYGILTGNYIQFLTLLKSGELKKHLGDLPMIFIFFWESDGFDRTIPTLSGTAVFERSCYQVDKTTGRYEYNGNLANCYPFRSWLTWYVSNINYFSEKFPNFAFFTHAEKVEDFVLSHREIQYEINRQFKNSRYILAAANYGTSDKVAEHLKELNTHLNFPLIEIDLTAYAEELKSKGIATNFEPYDHHPRAVMYKEAAKQLKEKLTPYLREIAADPHCKL